MFLYYTLKNEKKLKNKMILSYLKMENRIFSTIIHSMQILLTSFVPIKTRRKKNVIMPYTSLQKLLTYLISFILHIPIFLPPSIGKSISFIEKI